MPARTMSAPKVCRLCFMKHSRHYAPSRTMPPHVVSMLPAGLWPRIMGHSSRVVVGILGE